jgi:hypothetical protein
LPGLTDDIRYLRSTRDRYVLTEVWIGRNFYLVVPADRSRTCALGAAFPLAISGRKSFDSLTERFNS